MPLARFLAGVRDFAVLFEPAERRALQHFFWCHGRLVLSILDELQPVFEVLTPSEGAWTRTTLPGIPRIGVASVWPLDSEASESNGDLLADVQDPITPSTTMLIERGKSPTILKRAPRNFTSDGLVVTRHEARSVDGERIPMCRWAPPGTTRLCT
jgi:prolyl oligopeptidase